MVSRKIKGVIQDLPWKKNFIAKAIQYERDIVPAHCSGKTATFSIIWQIFAHFCT